MSSNISVCILLSVCTRAYHWFFSFFREHRKEQVPCPLLILVSTPYDTSNARHKPFRLCTPAHAPTQQKEFSHLTLQPALPQVFYSLSQGITQTRAPEKCWWGKGTRQDQLPCLCQSTDFTYTNIQHCNKHIWAVWMKTVADKPFLLWF